MDCTYAQRWLWALDAGLADRSQYNVYQAVRVDGALRAGRLRAAVEVLLSRYELLRSCYRMVEGTLCATVLPVDGAILHEADAGSLEAATDLAAAFVKRPFDLGTEAPIRMLAIRIGPADWVLVLCLHHIAVDAASMDMLWHELGRAYDGQPLPPPGLSPAELAARETRLRAEESYQEDLGDWLAELAGWTPPELPTDRPRAARRSGRGGQVELELGAEMGDRIAEVAAQRGSTVFLTAIAAVSLVLVRWSGRAEVAVATAVSNRDDIELETAIGYLVNTVVIRARADRDDSVGKFLDRVRGTALDALFRAQVPFAELVTELGAARDPSRNPLADVLVNYVKEGEPGFRPTGLLVRALRLAAQSARFDLDLSVTDRQGRLWLAIAYATDLFDQATVVRFARHVRTALRELCAHPDRRLDEVSLLDDAEHDEVVTEHNRTGEPIDPRRVHEVFEDWVRQTPSAPAVYCGHTSWSYRDLGRAADAVAQRLLRRGVGPGDRVAIRLGRGIELPAAIFGVLKTGAAYVPIDPGLVPERVRLLVADSGATITLTEELLADWALDGLGDTGEPRPLPAGFAAEPAYLIFTSGSTGGPKAVIVTHHAVVNLSADLARRFAWGPGEVVAAVAPQSFDMSVPELVAPLLAGAAIRLVPRDAAYDAALLAAELREVSFAQLTPAHWQLLLDSGWSDPRLRAACGAEAFPAALAVRLAGAVGRLWNLYGPTETTVWSTAHLVGAPAPDRPVPIGLPLANTIALVLDENLNPVPIGVVGELYLGGAGLAQGYHGAPALTAQRFLPDPFHPGLRLYRTGDLVRRRADGNLEFTARVDDQVKVRGFRIEPGEVEAALRRHPDVVSAAVTASGDRLVGYVVLRPGGRTAEVRAFVAALLPGYLVPAALVALDALPLTPNGKLDRATLSRTDPPLSASAAATPRTETEQAVAAAFGRVLGIATVGAQDDFFVLGGHSLNAVEVVSLLRPEFGTRITVALLFERPRVAGLAAALTGESGSAAAEVIVPGRTDVAPLSIVQQKFWELEQANPGRTESNVPRVLRLRGLVDADRLEHALHAVAARHDVLRVRFQPGAGEPRAVPGVAPPLLRDCFQPGPGEPRAVPGVAAPPLLRGHADLARATTLAQQDTDTPFDLAAGPLWRARLVHVTDTEHLLVLVFHHAIIDGTSFPVLWRDLAAAYLGEPLGRPVLQYGDYARAQRNASVTDADLAYWRRQLVDWPVTELPLDRPRPAQRSGRGADLPFTVPPPVAQGLRDLARARGATVFAVALAALSTLATRLCGTREVVFGTPVSGRDRPEFDELIGCFAGIVILRVDCTGDPHFRELLTRVSTTVTQAHTHQRLPFGHVARALGDAQPPRFQIAFVVADNERLALPGVHAELISVPVTTTNYEIIVELYDNGPGFDGWIVWDPDLYDPATMAGFAEAYQRLLAEVAHDSVRPLSGLLGAERTAVTP